MDIQDIAETIQEREAEERRDQVKGKRVALWISFLALMLAVTGLGGNNATKDMIASSIQASDTWSFYQAKTIRQTTYLLAADEMEALSSYPDLPPEAKAAMTERVNKYRATVKRYDSEADGTGKKELMEKAKAFEAAREHAQAQDPYFDYAEALLQISVVLASAALIAGAPLLLWLSVGGGLIGTLLMIDGYTLLINLPFL